MRAAYANEQHNGFKKDAPYKRTGVKEVTPLSLLPFFNVVWDVLPDLMHVIPDIWKGHLFPMFRGKRFPAPVKDRKSWSKQKNTALQRDHTQAVRHIQSWTLDKVLWTLCSQCWHDFDNVDIMCIMSTLCFNVCTFHAQCQVKGELLDRRSRSLSGEPSWIRSNIEIFSHSGACTSHDWIQLIQSAGDYILADVLDDGPKSDSLYGLLWICNKLLTTTSPFDTDNREDVDLLKREVVLVLC